MIDPHAAATAAMTSPATAMTVTKVDSAVASMTQRYPSRLKTSNSRESYSP